jgi:hypothetical protein
MADVVSGVAVSAPNSLQVTSAGSTTAIVQSFPGATGSQTLTATFEVNVTQCGRSFIYEPLAVIQLGNGNDPALFLWPQGDAGSTGFGLVGGSYRDGGASLGSNSSIPVTLGEWIPVTMELDLASTYPTAAITAGGMMTYTAPVTGPASSVSLEIGVFEFLDCEVYFDNVTFAWGT